MNEDPLKASKEKETIHGITRRNGRQRLFKPLALFRANTARNASVQ
jgi:hypothetical protein